MIGSELEGVLSLKPDFPPDTPRRFARLLRLTEQADEPWAAGDLAAIWRQEVQRFPDGLGQNDDNPSPRKFGADGGPGSTTVGTWSHLLSHPEPPIELLRQMKDFAKSRRHASSDAFPKDIARVLYFVSILLALMRCHRPISRLSKAEVLRGVEWSLAQRWLDPETLTVLTQGKHYLE